MSILQAEFVGKRSNGRFACSRRMKPEGNAVVVCEKGRIPGSAPGSGGEQGEQEKTCEHTTNNHRKVREGQPGFLLSESRFSAVTCALSFAQASSGTVRSRPTVM